MENDIKYHSYIDIKLVAKMVGKALVEILKPDNTWSKVYYAVDKGALCYTHTKKGTSLSSFVTPIL